MFHNHKSDIRRHPTPPHHNERLRHLRRRLHIIIGIPPFPSPLDRIESCRITSDRGGWIHHHPLFKREIVCLADGTLLHLRRKHFINVYTHPVSLRVSCWRKLFYDHHRVPCRKIVKWTLLWTTLLNSVRNAILSRLLIIGSLMDTDWLGRNLSLNFKLDLMVIGIF